MPPLEQRLTLFIDFLKAHSFILARAMEAAVYGAHGGPEAFDFDRTYLLIALAYRGDCAGNPARAFSVECIDLIRYNPAKYTDDVHKNLEARRARLDGECGNRSLGSLRIMYRTAERHPEEDFKRWDVQPIFKPARARGFCIPMPPVAQQLCGDKRCSELMSASEHGLVVRHDTNEDRCVIGELLKSGPHWRWVRLTPTQLRDRGLPAVFNDSRKFDLVSGSPCTAYASHSATYAPGLIITRSLSPPLAYVSLRLWRIHAPASVSNLDHRDNFNHIRRSVPLGHPPWF